MHSSSRHGPLTMILLMLVVGFSVHQLTLPVGWTPPFEGKAMLPPDYGTGLTVVIDPRGWSDLPQTLERLGLETSLPLGPGLLQWSAGIVRPLSAPDKVTGYRATLGIDQGGFKLTAGLRQTSHGPGLLSGPLEAAVPTNLLGLGGSPVDTEVLGLLPTDGSRLLVVDPGDWRLPATLVAGLQKELQRWEFSLRPELEDSLGPPFGFAEWRGQRLLFSGVRSPAKLQSLIQARVPDSVIHTKSRWIQGVRVAGFADSKGPAWFSRGDYVVAASQGGTNFLAALLDARAKPETDDRLLLEFRRLAESQPGWSILLWDRSSNSPARWAALLRWADFKAGKLQGFLVVDVQPPAKP